MPHKASRGARSYRHYRSVRPHVSGEAITPKAAISDGSAAQEVKKRGVGSVSYKEHIARALIGMLSATVFQPMVQIRTPAGDSTLVLHCLGLKDKNIMRPDLLKVWFPRPEELNELRRDELSHHKLFLSGRGRCKDLKPCTPCQFG